MKGRSASEEKVTHPRRVAVSTLVLVIMSPNVVATVHRIDLH